MPDRIYRTFLEQQCGELDELARNSSAIRYTAIRSDESLPPNIFLIELSCAHLVTDDDDVPQVSDGPCGFAIQLPGDYLRRTYPNPAHLLSLIEPRGIFHPNIRWPFICSGHIAPGTSVIELVLRVHEILTFNRFTPREDDCLNPLACKWAREHASTLPLEQKPLRDLPGNGSEVNQ